MFKFMCIIISVLFSVSSWGKSYNINACIDGQKSLYQCIDEFVKEKLPDTDWCAIAPVDKDDKAQGFFIITIKLSSKDKAFSQEAHFLKAGTNGKLVSKAFGTWFLRNRAINISYNEALSTYSNVKFPTSVKIDFKDLTGEKLVLSSHQNSLTPNFGPITFQKCSRLTNAL